MKINNSIIDSYPDLESLMNIRDINRSNVIKVANTLLCAIPRKRDDWKIKTKIVLYTQMTMTGMYKHKQLAVGKLKEILKENPDCLNYYFNVAERLKEAANC